MRASRVVAPCLLVAVISCAHSGTATPAPKPAPAPTPAPAVTATAAATAGGRAGAPGGGGRGGPPLTPEQRVARRDSLSLVRATTVANLMATIAGKEDQPAGQVFKNVQLMKDMPARKFLVMMDSTFGRALSANCTSCHVPTDYANDTRPNKGRTRIMIAMMNAINTEHLTKMPAGRGGNTPVINCMTCHRGNGSPGNAILP